MFLGHINVIIPRVPFVPLSSHGLSSPSPGSASSPKMNREEPEIVKVWLELRQRGPDHVVEGVNLRVMLNSTPGTQVWAGRFRLFHISYSEDGSRLSSQIRFMWSLGPQCMWKPCITGDLCSHRSSGKTCLQATQSTGRCPRMVTSYQRI